MVDSPNNASSCANESDGNLTEEDLMLLLSEEDVQADIWHQLQQEQHHGDDPDDTADDRIDIDLQQHSEEMLIPGSPVAEDMNIDDETMFGMYIYG